MKEFLVTWGGLSVVLGVGLLSFYGVLTFAERRDDHFGPFVSIALVFFTLTAFLVAVIVSGQP